MDASLSGQPKGVLPEEAQAGDHTPSATPVAVQAPAASPLDHTLQLSHAHHEERNMPLDTGQTLHKDLQPDSIGNDVSHRTGFHLNNAQQSLNMQLGLHKPDNGLDSTSAQLAADPQRQAKQDLQGEEQLSPCEEACTAAVNLDVAQQPKQPQSAFSGFMTGKDSRPVQISAHAQTLARQLLQEQQQLEHWSNQAAETTASEKGALAQPEQQSVQQQAVSAHRSQHAATGQSQDLQTDVNQHKVNSMADVALQDARQAPVNEQTAELPTCASLHCDAADESQQLSAQGTSLVGLVQSADLQAQDEQMLTKDTLQVSKDTDAAAIADTASPKAQSSESRVCTCFTRGNGKAVQVSARGQARSRQMFQDGQQPDISVSKAASPALATSSVHQAEPELPAFTGFATGRNEVMKVSAEAQAHARRMFSADQDSQKPDNVKSQAANPAPATAQPAEQPVLTGFRTGAGNKTMQISAAQQARAKELFDKPQEAEQDSTQVTAAHLQSPAGQATAPTDSLIKQQEQEQQAANADSAQPKERNPSNLHDGSAASAAVGGCTDTAFKPNLTTGDYVVGYLYV